MTGQKLTRTIIKLTAITNSSNRCNVTLFKIFSLIAIINTSSKQLCNQRLPAWWQSTPHSVTHLLFPLTGGALSNAFLWRLSITYIGTKSRTKRPRKTKIGTEVAHVTHDSDTTTFKVKRLKASLLSAALTHEAGAAVTVRTYWSWEATSRLVESARRRTRRWGNQGGRKGRGISYCHAHSLYYVTLRYELSHKVAVDLLAPPASQAFVERLFSVCGMLSHGRRNRMEKSLKMRVMFCMRLNKERQH